MRSSSQMAKLPQVFFYMSGNLTELRLILCRRTEVISRCSANAADTVCLSSSVYLTA
jgi:hypothetical protein